MISIFYFAVPFFVLCIGATLLNFNEKYEIKEYYKKRIKKVVMPLICWSVILYYYKVYILKIMGKKKLILYIYGIYIMGIKSITFFLHYMAF